jgi:hypothetical protein
LFREKIKETAMKTGDHKPNAAADANEIVAIPSCQTFSRRNLLAGAAI